ncbi:MAG: hypothetical protein ACFFGZ_14260 [Candidatus Thorarchaeota archaeon]
MSNVPAEFHPSTIVPTYRAGGAGFVTSSKATWGRVARPVVTYGQISSTADLWPARFPIVVSVYELCQYFGT